jgi:hypothetical protein
MEDQKTTLIIQLPRKLLEEYKDLCYKNAQVMSKSIRIFIQDEIIRLQENLNKKAKNK